MFDVALANRVGEPAGLCVHTETYSFAPALEHAEDPTRADHFVRPADKLARIG